MITWDFYKYNVCFLDDPYYCGLRARIPNFVKSRKKKLEEKAKKDSQSSSPQAQPHVQAGQQRILPAPTLNSMSGVNGGVTSTNPLWWHSRLYSDLGPLGSMNFFTNYARIRYKCITSYKLNKKNYMLPYFFIIGLGPDAQQSNYQRNPVTSMMPYITGIISLFPNVLNVKFISIFYI